MTQSIDPGLQEAILNPFRLLKLGWPHVKLADYQADIIKSVWKGNKITVVPAANMLGKDFISSFIGLWFFASRTPCRVVTTSIDYDQLNGVLWGEIRRWLETCKIPLGLHVNHLHLRQLNPDGSIAGLSEMVGKTAQRGKKEGLLGRHVPKGPNGMAMALGIVDEASGCDDCHVEAMETWAHQILIIGNCYPTQNFFFRYAEGGDVPDPSTDYEKEPDAPVSIKVIRIRANQSPNVRLGLKQEALGLPVTHEEVIPGCMSFREYKFRRAAWSEERQAIGLDAIFYKGAQILLYPADWLQMSHEVARLLQEEGVRRKAKALGVDPAEGGDDTVWTVVDELGIIKQEAIATNDTSTIFSTTIDMAANYGIPPEAWWFDAGGGGKQLVQMMKRKRLNANFVPFGGSPFSPEKGENGMPLVDPKSVFKNRRAQMMGELRDELNPSGYSIVTERIDATNHESYVPRVRDEIGGVPAIFSIGIEHTELIRQMEPIPLTRDEYDRLYIIPKSKPRPGYTGQTIKDLIGRSPDHLDSLSLAVHGRINKITKRRAHFR